LPAPAKYAYNDPAPDAPEGEARQLACQSRLSGPTLGSAASSVPHEGPGASLGLGLEESHRIPARDTGGATPGGSGPGARRTSCPCASGRWNTRSRHRRGQRPVSREGTWGGLPASVCGLAVGGGRRLDGLIPFGFSSGAAMPSIWPGWSLSGSVRSAAWVPRAAAPWGLQPGATAAERLEDKLQPTVPAEGGQTARRLPAPSRYAYDAPAPTAPGRRRRLPAGVTEVGCQLHPWVRRPVVVRLRLDVGKGDGLGFEEQAD
jgi:hypothetical protein